MAGFKERLSAARERSPLLDHAVRTVQHYGSVNGSQQAAGVTYFGFLSVFPVLALAFFVVGWIARVAPAARDALTTAVSDVLPGLIGDPPHGISLTEIQNSAGAVGIIGLAGVLYAGLGWLSALRTALIAVFCEPARMRPNFIMGKLRDFSGLVVLGSVLLIGVAVSGGVAQGSGRVLEWLHLSSGMGWLVVVIGIVVGLAVNAVMFFLMFWLLARPRLPDRALWQGAALAAVGFEALKQLSGVLLASTRGQPAFQAFGIALILLVWINYFSQLTLYAAAWAYTSPASDEARAERERRTMYPALVAQAEDEQTQQPGQTGDAGQAGHRDAGGVSQVAAPRHRAGATSFLSGAGAMLALVVLAKQKRTR